MKEKDVIYNVKVTRLDNFEVKKYIGACERPIKSRIYGHRTNMKKITLDGAGDSSKFL